MEAPPDDGKRHALGNHHGAQRIPGKAEQRHAVNFSGYEGRNASGAASFFKNPAAREENCAPREIALSPPGAADREDEAAAVGKL